MAKKYYEFKGMDYIINYPDDFKEGEKYPVILMLHGAGGRGRDMTVIRDHPFFYHTKDMLDFPFVSFAPQCYTNTWFDLWQTLESFVKYIVTLPFVDTKRIYLTGASMGGYATWQLSMSMPEYFAAIAPICGGGMYWNAGRLANVPVWAFHGGKDNTVFCEESQKMVDAVKNNGGNAKLTIYPENGHDAWSDTFSNPELYEWFLQHTNNNEIVLKDDYDNTGDFG